jgi:hypothetical protein
MNSTVKTQQVIKVNPQSSCLDEGQSSFIPNITLKNTIIVAIIGHNIVSIIEVIRITL